MVTRKRLAVILVTTTTNWLTNDGENTEPEGWEAAKDRIETHLQYSHGGIGGVGLTFKTEFVEWEEADS